MYSILEKDVFNSHLWQTKNASKSVQDYDCPYCYNTVTKIMRKKRLLQMENRPDRLTKAENEAEKRTNY